MNILTFDVEEWFHLLDNDSTRSAEQWERYEVRIYENVERILRILDETGTHATFFIKILTQRFMNRTVAKPKIYQL